MWNEWENHVALFFFLNTTPENEFVLHENEHDTILHHCIRLHFQRERGQEQHRNKSPIGNPLEMWYTCGNNESI